MVTDCAKPTRPRRRWFQYSLRALFAFVTLTSMGLALWILAISPYVRQYYATQQIATIEGQSGETETSGPFQPEWTSESVLPDWLRWLPLSNQMVKVKCVDLMHCEVTDKKLECLSSLRDLERLYLPATDVSDKTLEIVAQLPKLKRLSLWRTKVTDRGIQHLGQLKTLEALDIQETVATEGCLKALERLPNLKVLRHDIVLSDKGLEHLSRFPRLRQGFGRGVRLHGVTDRGIAHLGLFKKATRLSVDGYRGQRGWHRLAELDQLTGVELAGMEVGAELTTALSKLPKLINLKIRDAQVTGSWSQLVEPLRKQGATLLVHRTPCSHESLTALSQFSGGRIELGRCPGVSLATFGRVFGPTARSLSIRQRRFSMGARPTFHVDPSEPITGLTGLEQFTRLERLDIDHQQAIDGLEMLARLPQLKVLSIALPPNDETVKHISRAAELTSLILQARSPGVAVTADGLSRLADLQKLESLELTGVASSDQHFEFLARMPQLRRLRIDADHHMTNAGLLHLENLKNLKRLVISDADVTNDGLQPLYQLTCLKELYFYSKTVSKAGVEPLKKALPNCRMHHW